MGPTSAISEGKIVFQELLGLRNKTSQEAVDMKVRDLSRKIPPALNADKGVPSLLSICDRFIAKNIDDDVISTFPTIDLINFPHLEGAFRSHLASRLEKVACEVGVGFQQVPPEKIYVQSTIRDCDTEPAYRKMPAPYKDVAVYLETNKSASSFIKCANAISDLSIGGILNSAHFASLAMELIESNQTLPSVKIVHLNMDHFNIRWSEHITQILRRCPNVEVVSLEGSAFQSFKEQGSIEIFKKYTLWKGLQGKTKKEIGVKKTFDCELTKKPVILQGPMRRIYEI